MLALLPSITENHFFDECLTEIKDAFDKSPIKKYQASIGKSWGYSICATPIKKKAPVLLGINWGGDSGVPQTTMPDGLDILSYPFIQRSMPYIYPPQAICNSLQTLKGSRKGLGKLNSH